jgi:hypothetical protein
VARRQRPLCATGARGVSALAVALSACASQQTSAPPAAVAHVQRAPNVVTSSPAQVPQAEPLGRYSYEDVLAMLRTDDAVVPARPPVHPYHTVYNREAIVPPMCYTRTEGQHNPCYVCHQDRVPGRPNAMNDGQLQLAYSFSELGAQNHWQNLFEDRSARVAAISDAEIKAWVAGDNYSELEGRLRAAGFKGYVPDLGDLARGAEAFDEEGFARDGSHWVAFNYMPLPSTFWPTNGSTDDVMIRLPQSFRSAADGQYARDVYRANLALVEANIKGLDAVSVAPIDERVVGSDLDGDGVLGTAERITRHASYVGAAARELKRAFLYPRDTEFLHSVRYVGVDAKGAVFVPPRMKELRYMRKYFPRTEPQLAEAYLLEQIAKDKGELPGYVDRGEHGLDNELGWVLSGFIENRAGRLRAANYEETLYCMGCHSSIGSTIDSTFSFARKVDGRDGWGYVNLRGMPDAPSRGERKGEIATYLARAGGGDELRSNTEMLARWFKDGHVDERKVRAATDVYTLITPSRRRALELDKAYRVIVEDQDFVYGRDATVVPPANVYTAVDPETAPTLPEALAQRWDIRLDWSRTSLPARTPRAPRLVSSSK